MSHITNRERRKLGRVWNKILHDRYLCALWEFPSKDCQTQSVTDEATGGRPLHSALAVWSTVITVVTSESKSAIQYIRWPKRCPVRHPVVADSCPDVKNEGKDGFQQAFIEDFHLSLKVDGKTTDHVVSPYIIEQHNQGEQGGSNLQPIRKITSEAMCCTIHSSHLA